ncbi:hypothetical protein RCL1_007875 [Eukaryota sp. TZLM3-RCL]
MEAPPVKRRHLISDYFTPVARPPIEQLIGVEIEEVLPKLPKSDQQQASVILRTVQLPQKNSQRPTTYSSISMEEKLKVVKYMITVFTKKLEKCEE